MKGIFCRRKKWIEITLFMEGEKLSNVPFDLHNKTHIYTEGGKRHGKNARTQESRREKNE